MNKALITILAIMSFICVNAQTTIKPSNVVISHSLRPPIDTATLPYYQYEVRYNTSNNKWYFAQSLTGLKWLPVNPTDTNTIATRARVQKVTDSILSVQDTLVVVNTFTAGLRPVYTSPAYDTLYVKRWIAGGGVSLTQNNDSSITVAAVSNTFRVVNDADFTMGATDYAVLIKNNTVSVRTATLPDPTTNSGKSYEIANSGTQNVTLSRNIRVDPSTTTTTLGTAKTIKIQSDGTEYWEIAYWSR